MKNKLLKFLILVIGLLLVSPVSAKENKIYIYEKDHKLYYDGEFADENIFMKHLNILPGESFVDNLTIENGSDKTFTIYFGIEESNKGSAKDLLDYITMKIELDGEVIYNGKLDGLDYDSSGIDLQKKIKLKEYSKGDKSVMKVTTALSSEYDNYQNFNKSVITWHFYAETEEDVEEIEYNPKTGDNIIFFIIILLVAVFIYIYILFLEKRKKINKKNIKNKKKKRKK